MGKDNSEFFNIIIKELEKKDIIITEKILEKIPFIIKKLDVNN